MSRSPDRRRDSPPRRPRYSRSPPRRHSSRYDDDDRHYSRRDDGDRHYSRHSPRRRHDSRSPRRRWSRSRSPRRHHASRSPRRRHDSRSPRRRHSRSPPRHYRRSHSRSPPRHHHDRRDDRGRWGGGGGGGRAHPGGWERRGRPRHRGPLPAPAPRGSPDPARPHDTRRIKPIPPATGLTMFVAGIPRAARAADVRAKFEAFGGAVTAVRFAPRGVAFVALDSEEAVDKAIAALDGAPWEDRTMLVERARTVLDAGEGMKTGEGVKAAADAMQEN